MAVGVFITVVVTSIIQSMFGVGVLLFGTPTLLVLGYPFVQVLTILLPISFTINVIQIGKHHRYVDMVFYKKILVFTIPFVILFLLLVTRLTIKMNGIVGLFLIFAAGKNASRRLERLVASLVRYERTYLIAMGVIHGLTNLGGSLLTAIVHAKNYEKDRTRVTTAVAYGTFALFQMATLALSEARLVISHATNALYLITGELVFFTTERVLYSKIDNEKYRLVFAVFLFISGALLLSKAFLG